MASIVREIEREYDPAAAGAAALDTFSYGLLYESQVCQAAKIEQALPGLAGPASDTTAWSPSFVNHQG